MSARKAQQPHQQTTNTTNSGRSQERTYAAVVSSSTSKADKITNHGGGGSSSLMDPCAPPFTPYADPIQLHIDSILKTSSPGLPDSPSRQNGVTGEPGVVTNFSQASIPPRRDLRNTSESSFGNTFRRVHLESDSHRQHTWEMLTSDNSVCPSSAYSQDRNILTSTSLQRDQEQSETRSLTEDHIRGQLDKHQSVAADLFLRTVSRNTSRHLKARERLEGPTRPASGGLIKNGISDGMVLSSQQRAKNTPTNNVEVPLCLPIAMHIPFYGCQNVVPFPPYFLPTTPDSTPISNKMPNSIPVAERSCSTVPKARLHDVPYLPYSNASKPAARYNKAPRRIEGNVAVRDPTSLLGSVGGWHPANASPHSSDEGLIHYSTPIQPNTTKASPDSSMLYLQTDRVSNPPASSIQSHTSSIGVGTLPKHLSSTTINQDVKGNFSQDTFLMNAQQLLEARSEHGASRATTRSSTSAPTFIQKRNENPQTHRGQHGVTIAPFTSITSQEECIKSTISLSDWPPLGAPTEPALLRRKKMNCSQASSQTYNIQNGADSGSWSHSKRWTSQATKERIAFQRLTLNLQHMGANKSPFLPQTPAELAALRADIAEAEKQKLAREVEKRMARNQAEAASNEHKQAPVRQEAKLFCGKTFNDHLSPFFAVESCFNKDRPDSNHDRVDWPCLAELKEEGDKRAATYNRYLPLPRVNVVAERILQKEGERAYNQDGSIPWEKKSIKLAARSIRPVTPRAPLMMRIVTELSIEELPGWIQALLKMIDQDDDDGKSVEPVGKTEQ